MLRTTPLFTAMIVVPVLALATSLESHGVPPVGARTATDPQVTAPRATPSGARSPARVKRQRKGTIARSAPRSLAVAATPSGVSGNNKAPIDPVTGAPITPLPDSVALERALAIPENSEFRVWYEAPHIFDAPRGRLNFMPFTDWSSDDGCIVRREGNTKYMKAGCAPRALQVRVSVPREYGEALESHFGFPPAMLEQIACYPNDGSCQAVQAAVTQVLAKHGISCTDERICPDYQWVLDRSVNQVSDVAVAVINSTYGAGAPVTRRQRVEALTSFVQNAIPYRPVKSAKDDLMKDGKNRCGLRTPVVTLFEGGDCDSKSLLLASLIRAVDPSVGLSLVYCMSGDTPHMVLAVGCDAESDEQCLMVDGSPRVMIETTSDWDVGHLGTAIDLQDAEAEGLK